MRYPRGTLVACSASLDALGAPGEMTNRAAPGPSQPPRRSRGFELSSWHDAGMSDHAVVGALDQVDLITKRGSDWVVLIMVQVAEWDDSEDQRSGLQAKLSNYLSFVLDGGLAAQHPSLARAQWTIRLDCQSEPPPHTRQFLQSAQELVRQRGGVLEVGRLWT